ncbi:TetR/AcrR family transcriptional regulator [Actinophytocola glycyrrhizae]|uniref:TetR/AcrR family transcriptional regulator n=1 Tax=Actinophytocola glycyrrhizae TaxID=2044873 RepID=A0ABV9SC93_9PSEU
MSQIAERKPVRRQIDKFAVRRAQLANSALRTLSKLGYAGTSLRDIAENSEFSHGVLHYYFRDKVDLITYCVRQYKAASVARYDQVVAVSTTPDELRDQWIGAMVATLRQDAPMHRLWYDLRNQSMFSEAFREDVRAIDSSLERMIGRIFGHYAQLAGLRLTTSAYLAYALVDGVFQNALLGHLSGDERATADLPEHLSFVLDRVVR